MQRFQLWPVLVCLDLSREATKTDRMEVLCLYHPQLLTTKTRNLAFYDATDWTEAACFMEMWLIRLTLCVCGSVCLQPSCLSQRLHRLIGLIAPQEAGPKLWTVGRHRCHPDSPLVLGDELQLLAQLEVSSRSWSASFNLPLTHSPYHPFNSHTLSPDCACSSAKESSIFLLTQSLLIGPGREDRGFYDFLFWLSLLFFTGSAAFHKYTLQFYYILTCLDSTPYKLLSVPACSSVKLPCSVFMFGLPLACGVCF